MATNRQLRRFLYGVKPPSAGLVFGQDDCNCVKPMTITEAQKVLADFPEEDGVIYELVEYEPS